jgi:NADH dehydrogenase
MRVAVLGAGYAGLTLARRLERRLPDGAELVVVDDTGTHLLQHEIHRIVRRPSIADSLAVPLADVLDRAEIVVDRVTGVDPDAGVATLADGGDLAYDYGAVCLGAETAHYGLAGVEEHATPLKRVAHAERIREQFHGRTLPGGTAVVGGAGLSGVQIAGELTALAREEGVAESVDVVLVEQADDVAPAFPPPFRAAIREALSDRGVDVRTGRRVTGATAEAVGLEGGDLPYDQFVWTGGIEGSDAMDGARPTVRADLRLSASTFAVGDAARAVDADGEPVPASAAAAVREAGTVADNVAELVSDRGGFEPRLDRFRFDAPGWIVSVGEATVAQIGPAVVTGAPAKALKAGVGAELLASAGEVRRALEFVEAELDA